MWKKLSNWGNRKKSIKNESRIQTHFFQKQYINNEDNTNNYAHTLPVNREMQITTTNKRHHFITITKMNRGNKNFWKCEFYETLMHCYLGE